MARGSRLLHSYFACICLAIAIGDSQEEQFTGEISPYRSKPIFPKVSCPSSLFASKLARLECSSSTVLMGLNCGCGAGELALDEGADGKVSFWFGARLFAKVLCKLNSTGL